MIELPKRFEKKINDDKEGSIKGPAYFTQSKFNEVFSENRLYFFEEYTDHGWRHINSVLKSCDELIPDKTFRLLSKKDIIILVLGVFLHDLGMHLQPLTFKAIVTGEYDDVLNKGLNDIPWSDLWQSYLVETKKFSDHQRLNIFGSAAVDIKEPDLNSIGKLTDNDRKLIGEFIRRHHPRIAAEVAFKGLKTNAGQQLDFLAGFGDDYRLLAGILARSHGMQVRDTFNVLETAYNKLWKRPLKTHIIYLMALLRLADYFQIDEDRILKIPYQTRLFQSPVSFTEHQKHLQTKSAQPLDDNPEVLFILAEPVNSKYFLALENLFNDIQKELDGCWAILGAEYGNKRHSEQPMLSYRRVQSNLNDKAYCKKFKYVPERITFSVDKEIPKLLVGPLYKDNPSCGVRELIQNAADACKEREFLEKKNGNDTYKGKIKVKIDQVDEYSYLFSIQDNGKGMTVQEIKEYFLKIGGTFRKSSQWQTDYLDQDGLSVVSKGGRFGIGVLAAYLLGAEINVTTKSIHAESGLRFRTKLDEEQIEIEKYDSEEDFGTTITIIMSKAVVNKLLSRRLYDDNNNELIRFYEWYVLRDIDISYEMNVEDIEHYVPSGGVVLRDIDVNSYQEIKDKDFKTILWVYDHSKRFAHNIICNGIIIPAMYHLSAFVSPTLIVSDFDAKLPLSLDRNSLTSAIPFEKALLKDICRDILAKLLTFDVLDMVNEKKQASYGHTYFKHPAIKESTGPLSNFNRLFYIVYSKSGFTADSSVFLNFFKGKNHFRIGSNHLASLQGGLDKLFLNAEFISFFPPIGDINYLQEPHNERGLEMHSNLSRIGGKLLNWSSNFDKYVKGKRSPNLDISNSKITEFFIEEIQDLSLNEYDIFNEIVLEFLGNDVLIPYCMEDRIAKFPKAFKELDKYMKKYRT